MAEEGWIENGIGGRRGQKVTAGVGLPPKAPAEPHSKIAISGKDKRGATGGELTGLAC